MMMLFHFFEMPVQIKKVKMLRKMIPIDSGFSKLTSSKFEANCV